MKLTPQGLWLTEVNGRMGGCIEPLPRRSARFDLLRAALALPTQIPQMDTAAGRSLHWRNRTGAARYDSRHRRRP